MAIWRPTDATPLTPLRTPFGLLADSVEAELDARGFTRYATKADMDANTTAADGTHATVYADSTPANNGDYVSDGSTWSRRNAFATAAGSIHLPISAYTTVPFPVGRFTVAPLVQISVSGSDVGTVLVPWRNGAVTISGFAVQLFTLGGASAAGTIEWTATQMTPATAAG